MPGKGIIIAAVPRSGSSLIASIFAAHGVWVGMHHHKTNMANTPVPYPSFENRNIDAWFKDPLGVGLDELVQALVPAGKRWLYKCKPDKAQKAVQKLARFQPLLVRVVRQPRGIIKSSASGKEDVRRRQIRQLANMPGPAIYSDAVLDRDFSSLEAAFEYCGLDFSAQIAEAQIVDELWHHRESASC